MKRVNKLRLAFGQLAALRVETAVRRQKVYEDMLAGLKLSRSDMLALSTSTLDTDAEETNPATNTQFEGEDLPVPSRLLHGEDSGAATGGHSSGGGGGGSSSAAAAPSPSPSPAVAHEPVIPKPAAKEERNSEEAPQVSPPAPQEEADPFSDEIEL